MDTETLVPDISSKNLDDIMNHKEEIINRIRNNIQIDLYRNSSGDVTIRVNSGKLKKYVREIMREFKRD